MYHEAAPDQGREIYDPQKTEKKIKKLNVLKYWMFSLGAGGFAYSSNALIKDQEY